VISIHVHRSGRALAEVGDRVVMVSFWVRDTQEVSITLALTQEEAAALVRELQEVVKQARV